MQRKYKIVQEKNLVAREKKVQRLLDEGWMPIQSTYAGDGWVEYILFKGGSECNSAS